MGSSNQTGGEDPNFIQNNIEKFIQQILDKNLTDPLNNKYCESIRITLNDELLSKLTKAQLLAKNSKYQIGFVNNDSVTKKEICKSLTNYYTKKIEIIHTIHYLLNLISNKIGNQTTKSRCFSTNKGLSKIKYGNSKNWSTIPDSIKNTVKLSELRTQMFKETNLDPSQYYYVNELDNSDDCTKNKGRWIKGIDALHKLNLIPDDKIKEYNQKYYRLINSLDNIHITAIEKLTVVFKKLCKEEFVDVELKDGITKKTKILLELPVSNDELILIEQEVVTIISTDIVQIETYYLQLVSLDIITPTEVDNFKAMTNELKNIESTLTSSN